MHVRWNSGYMNWYIFCRTQAKPHTTTNKFIIIITQPSDRARTASVAQQFRYYARTRRGRSWRWSPRTRGSLWNLVPSTQPGCPCSYTVWRTLDILPLSLEAWNIAQEFHKESEQLGSFLRAKTPNAQWGLNRRFYN